MPSQKCYALFNKKNLFKLIHFLKCSICYTKIIHCECLFVVEQTIELILLQATLYALYAVKLGYIIDYILGDQTCVYCIYLFLSFFLNRSFLQIQA